MVIESGGIFLIILQDRRLACLQILKPGVEW